LNSSWTSEDDRKSSENGNSADTFPSGDVSADSDARFVRNLSRIWLSDSVVPEGVGGSEDDEREDGDSAAVSVNMKSISSEANRSSLLLEPRLDSIEMGVETSDVSELEFDGDEARLE